MRNRIEKQSFEIVDTVERATLYSWWGMSTRLYIVRPCRSHHLTGENPVCLRH